MANDGGTLALDWYQGCDLQAFAPPGTPILLVLHGINGGAGGGGMGEEGGHACGAR